MDQSDQLDITVSVSIAVITRNQETKSASITGGDLSSLNFICVCSSGCCSGLPVQLPELPLTLPVTLPVGYHL